MRVWQRTDQRHTQEYRGQGANVTEIYVRFVVPGIMWKAIISLIISLIFNGAVLADNIIALRHKHHNDVHNGKIDVLKI